MKNLLLGFLACTMLLFVPLVSYGSDEAPIENSDVVLVDSYDNVDVVAVATPTLEIGDHMTISTESNYATVTTIALHSKSAVDATIAALTNRAKWLADTNKHTFNRNSIDATNTGKIRKYPSNHVGKLIHRTTNK